MPTNRGGCITPIQQLLLTLRFYATGNMLITVADFMGVSEASASRIVERVSRAIASRSQKYIKMPETEAEMEEIAENFYKIASFPRVIGAIDCTLIRRDSPGGNDAEIFRCRKSFFALNVQTVSDAKLKIRNIVCRWPGSVHDQTIFNNSLLKYNFENNAFGSYILIGDSGYALKKYLMTKLQQPRTPAENLYDESIIRTRNTVERQYGVWKRRFPVLKFGTRLQLDRIRLIIVATAVLQNIAIDMNDIFTIENFEEEELEDNPQLFANAVNGEYVRNLLI
ncbi:putative nuclease HARBI1 [Coccinella septempunctata]|uniref:putative nuclease HARBI1 n=1 Tax=Coccinella septempunctata TaxID=41139 RepID=UPI001D07FD93|nr:putative nuclease HARBI1 [Coccinella septempunctata]